MNDWDKQMVPDYFIEISRSCTLDTVSIISFWLHNVLFFSSVCLSNSRPSKSCNSDCGLQFENSTVKEVNGWMDGRNLCSCQWASGCIYSGFEVMHFVNLCIFMHLLAQV